MLQPDQAVDDAALSGAKATLRKVIQFRRDARPAQQRLDDD